MKNRLIAIFFLVFTMIYLSTSVYAENIEVSVSNFWIIGANSTTDTGKIRWSSISEMPFTFVTYPSNTISYIYLMSKMADTPQDGQVLVWSIEIENTAMTQNLAVSEIGFIPESSVTSTISPFELNALDYNQNVIAKTHEKVNTNTVRYTTTVKISNPSSNYIIWKFGTVGLYDISNTNRIITELNVYESIEEAAGSGVTPEEMRDVLSSWGEEELLPGIEDSVQAGVTSGMEEALENEKQEASSDGAGNAEELQGAIDEALGDIEEVQKPFETLGSALSYNGQSATLTFPSMNVPFLGQISQPVSVNLTQKISEIMPTELLNIIRGVLSLALVVFPPLEVIRLFNKLLNKG